PAGRNRLGPAAVGQQGDGRRAAVEAAADAVRVDDRVKAVFAALGEASRAALLGTVELRQAVVPAPGPLAEVASECGHVSNLRRGRSFRGVRQGGIETP